MIWRSGGTSTKAAAHTERQSGPPKTLPTLGPVRPKKSQLSNRGQGRLKFKRPIRFATRVRGTASEFQGYA